MSGKRVILEMVDVRERLPDARQPSVSYNSGYLVMRENGRFASAVYDGPGKGWNPWANITHWAEKVTIEPPSEGGET